MIAWTKMLLIQMTQSESQQSVTVEERSRLNTSRIRIADTLRFLNVKPVS